MTSVNSNFNFLFGRPHGAGPPSPVHVCPPEPDPLPLHVDVINRWHLRTNSCSLFRFYKIPPFQNYLLEHCNIKAKYWVKKDMCFLIFETLIMISVPYFQLQSMKF